ncbi:MAG: thiamine phosphate synthase [Deltaproteobacteria bacterium]
MPRSQDPIHPSSANGNATGAKRLSGLYAVTDPVLTPPGRILGCVAKVLDGGARIVQLRDKAATNRDLLPIARALRDLCQGRGAVFIVNDRPGLVQDVSADGLHIGQEDIPPDEARRIIGPDKILGVSCYGDLDRAVDMERRGADYVAFGSFFPSPTKPAAPVVDPAILLEAKRRLSIPICAIGGITAENAGMLVERGADMVAVVSDLWRAPDIEARARSYMRLFGA